MDRTGVNDITSYIKQIEMLYYNKDTGVSVLKYFRFVFNLVFPFFITLCCNLFLMTFHIHMCIKGTMTISSKCLTSSVSWKKPHKRLSYSIRAVTVRERCWPTGVQRFRSLRLYSLSASLTSFAWQLQWGACSTCWRFLSCLGRPLSSVTSWTIRATIGPNFASSSAGLVSVSSTVSWSRAACNTKTTHRLSDTKNTGLDSN